MNHHDPTALLLILLLISIDYATGIIKSIIHKQLNSEKMRLGLWHKATYMITITLAAILEHGQHHLHTGLNLPLITPTITYIAIMETCSIIENLAQINPKIAHSRLLTLFKTPNTQNTTPNHPPTPTENNNTTTP